MPNTPDMPDMIRTAAPLRLLEKEFREGSIYGRGTRTRIDSFSRHFSNPQAGYWIRNQQDWKRHVDQWLQMKGSHPIPTLDPAPSPPAPPAIAVINHNGWSCTCPLCYGGSEYVDYLFPLFFCMNCENEDVGRRPLEVTFPSKPQILHIESALLLRPFARDRSLKATETVEDLLEENVKFAWPLPPGIVKSKGVWQFPNPSEGVIE